MAIALVWFRRDLRLHDNPALQAALDAGDTPVPVYLHVPGEEMPWPVGAASRVWLRRSLLALDVSLRAIGSRLVVSEGESSLALLRELIQRTDALTVHWNRLYEPAAIARDTSIKQTLRGQGIDVHSHDAALMTEPWTVATAQGTPYRVFTPFWRNARSQLRLQLVSEATARLPPIDSLLEAAGAEWSTPAVARIDQVLPAPESAWDRNFWAQWTPGERGAHEMLDAFVDGAAGHYASQRNLPGRIGSSRLSPHLHFGEISSRQIAQRLQSATWTPTQEKSIDAYIRELGWREFAHYLLFHFPTSAQSDFNPRFKDFHWAEPDPHLLRAWQHGRTGVPLVDAGMRELWHTGWMHNRVRMVVASFLTKHLRIHWMHGARWFWDTLVDADLANNSLGWQWTAGTGADAAPYFRVFNPVLQARRFDPKGVYVRRWLPGFSELPDNAQFEPWRFPDLLQQHAPDYPRLPIVDLAAGRAQALAAYAKVSVNQ
ncbi:MAG: deoxyribodipyrimidine photo-lyase [Lysobacteraceae bacterium]